ncbi:hypothetical protein M569_02580, partial [Genlisea aurea]
MGSGEESTPTKSPKPSPSETSMTPTTPAYPDWSSSVQAVYGAGAATPFFASPVASPATHPYLWGAQHPLMAPYGTPVPYPALYPPGGVYAAHPSMALTPGAVVHGAPESETKAAEGSNEHATKNSKFAPRSHVRKTGDGGGNAASGSGNDVCTQSAESGSEGSSDGSENNNQEYSAAKKGSFDQMLADGANAQNNGGNGFVIPIPVTNLNIGMDLWGNAAAPAAGSGSLKLHPNPHTVSPAAAPPSGMVNGQWVQDERELKRQKRKQSNRESARRSRLRKQAECEDLQQKVEALTNENRSLQDELRRLSEECEKLEAENSVIKEELARVCGTEMMSKLDS